MGRPETSLDRSVPVPLLVAVVVAVMFAAVAAGDAAMSSLPPGRIAALHEQMESGQKKQRLGRFMAQPARVLGRWLVARIVLTTVTAILMDQVSLLRQDAFRPLLSIGGTALLLSVLSQIATAVARERAAQIGPALMAVLRPLEILVIPLADPLSALGQVAGGWFERDATSEPEPRLTEQEVEYLVEDATKAGEMDAEPAEMIRNVLDFKDLTVKDVMVPRIKIRGIEVETPLEAVLDIITKQGHSRYPVYATRIDNVIGMLYAKDLFPVVRGGKMAQVKLRDIVRSPVNFLPDTQPVSAVLRDMRARSEHMALLVDEFGGVSGMVTLEDLIEQIVGEIRDEFDHDEAPIEDLGGGRLLADAAVSLADLSAYLGREIQGDGDYGSLGGLLTHEAGRMPATGDHIVAAGIEFIVRESDAKRIVKVEIVLPPESASRTTPPPPLSPAAPG